MRRFRVSVGGLMVVIVYVALAISGLRFASGLMGGITCLLSLGLLMLGVAGVVYRRNGQQAFYLGFVLFGWGYIAMAQQTWSVEHATDEWGLFTTKILDALQPYIESDDDGSLHWMGFGSAATHKIWLELEKQVSMPFANETSIEDILKYIKTVTSRPGLEGGIPIYVDPIGLSESEKTMASTVTLDVEGVPLRKTLKLILSQLDMTYIVKDGLLTITSKDSDGPRSWEPTPEFRRVGHCVIAVVFGFLGGCATRLFHGKPARSERTP